MTFDHSVKVNGIWYKAGDVIDTPSSVLHKTETVTNTKAEKVAPVDEDKPATPKRSLPKKGSKK